MKGYKQSLLFSAGIMLLLTMTSTHVTAENFWDPIPSHPSTNPPDEILDGYWRGVFNNVNSMVNASTDPKIVFFGNSITLAWGDKGKATWDEKYAPLNRAIQRNKTSKPHLL